MAAHVLRASGNLLRANAPVVGSRSSASALRHSRSPTPSVQPPQKDVERGSTGDRDLEVILRTHSLQGA
jgi:hypothetical protein